MLTVTRSNTNIERLPSWTCQLALQYSSQQLVNDPLVPSTPSTASEFIPVLAPATTHYFIHLAFAASWFTPACV